MQNEDDFGFRGCDGENCGLMYGRKEKRDRDFVEWEERVRVIGGCGVWWGMLREVKGYKRVNKSDKREFHSI